MQYCTRCLYPANHPLGITFDEEGVCSGCRVHEEKDVLDWQQRSGKLAKIFDAFRSRSGRNYDCIIPVSGARDSYFIVHTVRHVYKMRPLLVTYNKHYNTQLGIRNLAYLRSLIGADILTSTIAPQTVKKITKITLKKLASMYWHCIVGQAVFPVQTAVRFKIPLIVWGVHQGCDQVGMYSHQDEVEMTRRYRKDHDFMGMEAEDLIQGDDIDERDVKPFCFPHDKELESIGVRGIFLSNYIRWDSKKQHEDMLKLYKYETAYQHRTFDTYNDVDCFHYSDLHDHIKFCKWGYGKATDHACRELRLKRLTREEGIALVERFQNKLPDPGSLNLFLSWLGTSRDELFGHIDARRDPRIWKKAADGQWQLLDSVINHGSDAGIEKVRLIKKEDCEFTITPSKAPQIRDDQYVLVGRGWADQV
ncbi:MAG: N-acetyl sugar amidotransferase [Candidatus Omnitrophica bacterium]|nr:N-acetyl sugar amidotransferase [Candidatus Omnitrophota bacterium]